MMPRVRIFLAALAVAFFTGCGALSNHPEGDVPVEADGSGPDETSSMNAARRKAVSSLLDLYLSPEALKNGAEKLEQGVLARAKDFARRERELSRERVGGEVRRRMKIWVDVSGLGRALEADGLLRPDGVRGRPSVALSVKNSPAARERLAKDLTEHGYRVDPAGATADASLSAEATATEVNDARLEGLFGAKAKLSGTLRLAGETHPIEAEAQAFDVAAEGAAERALENVGLLAAEAARRRLAERFIERGELILIIENVGDEAGLRRFLNVLRAERGVTAVALGAVLDHDAKIRVFAERMSADELAARLLRLTSFPVQIRAVDTDGGQVEVVNAGGA